MRRVTDTLIDVHRKKCLYCGKAFDSKRSDALYDTGTCRAAAMRDRQGVGGVRKVKVRRRCDQCGKSYWTSQPDRSRFDTDGCRNRWHYLNRDK